MCREEIPLEVLKQIIISGCKFLSLFRSILVGDNFRLDQQPSQLKYLDLRQSHYIEVALRGISSKAGHN